MKNQKPLDEKETNGVGLVWRADSPAGKRGSKAQGTTSNPAPPTRVYAIRRAKILPGG